MSDNRNGAGSAAATHSDEPVGKPTYVNLPEHHVSSFTTIGQPDSLTMLCANPALAVDEAGGMGLAQKPRVVLHIPAVDVKELIVLLQDYVTTVEADRGPLTSEFLEARGVK